ESGGMGGVGDGGVGGEGGTKKLAIVGRHEPVADVVLGVGAEAMALPLRRERTPHAIGRFQCSDHLLLRQITQPQAAALALCILEVERLSAILAFEKLHGPGHPDSCCRSAA